MLQMPQNRAFCKKGVELKDVEDTDRPRTTSTRSTLTLKPLPKIDPKDKGKKKIEEEDETESEDDDIPQVVKKFKQLENDEELARKVQEEWEAEEEKNKIAEEEAANEALIKNFDDVKARIEADRILAEKLQEQEREQFTIEERAKFLHDTIAAQRKFLAQQRSQAIRNKPPTKNQLRNQMITYLKHVGNFKHANLKGRKFEDIQALYEKIKRLNEHFISTGSAKDERLIKKMNEKRGGLSKSEVIKEDTKEEVKDEDKDEESTRKRKLGTRKKMKSRKRRYIQHTSEDDTDKENDELRLCLKIAQDEEKEVDYEVLDKKYPIIDWKTQNYGTKPQLDEAKTNKEINLNVVTRSNGQQRHFSVLTSVLSIFDREDLNAVYQLVMNKYQDEMPEGFERVLWGDLMVLFNPDEQDEFWNSQHEWKIISWKLHSSSGVHTLMTNEGVVIHMLTEKKYPLKKEILVQMLNLRLESEEESTMALELIRFIKKNKELSIPEQTATGKGTSNPLMAGSLPKTIWFINAPCYYNEALASPNSNDKELSIPEQTATGKGTSNPLMAGSLPKTKNPTQLDCRYQDVSLWMKRLQSVSTAAGMTQEVEINIPSPVATKDKGKAVMQESEPPKKIKKRVQIQMSTDEELAQKLHEEEKAIFNAEQEPKFNEEQEQERLHYEGAMRIQEELDESERQRMSQVHQATHCFTDAEWDDILARVAADEDLVQQLQADEKYNEEDLPRKLVELVNQRKKFFA
ncbi:hypothetical protein Tco_0716080 [Tanacetum coccineum]